MQPLDCCWGGHGRSEKRMLGNSVLIPSHMNSTCSAVKLDGLMIMMSEFGPSAGQQLALLATLHWLTHVAFSNKGSKYVPYAQCQRNLSFLRKDVGKHLAGLVSGSKREAGMKHRLLFSNLFMATLKFAVNISWICNTYRGSSTLCLFVFSFIWIPGWKQKGLLFKKKFFTLIFWGDLHPKVCT